MQNNGGFPLDFIEKLKYNNDIVSLVSKYMLLQKKGKSYWGCCPFHHEKTPSFVVNENGQYFHCFGCGVGGDVIKFVEKIEGLDFWDAVKELAKNANMELPKFENSDAELMKKKQKRDLLITICTETAKFYYKKLNEPVGINARKYLEKRGVDKSTITKMGLGFSPDWTSLISYLKNKGYSEQDMLDAGVVSSKDGKIYDAMATRLIFPIFNHNSKVCGFSGRALKDGAFAKYKNTSNTEIFNKSYILYGINLLRKARLEKNYALLVEGQMDVIACHQAGFNNAIATLGTAFNNFHVQTLQRFVDSVVVCFDGDNAGKKAAVRSLEPLLNANFDVKIVTIPENKDPDEYIKKYGKEEFENLISKGQNVWEFEITSLASSYNLKDKLELSKFVDEALDIVCRISTFMERDIYLNLISSICSVNVEILKRELNNKLTTKEEKVYSNVEQDGNLKSQDIQHNKLFNAQEFIIASLLHKKDYIKDTKNDINSDLFVNNNFKQFYEFLVKNNYPIISQIYNYYDVDNIDWLKNIVYYNFDNVLKPNQHFIGCLKFLQLERLLQKQKELTQNLKTSNGEDKIKILKEIQNLTKEIQQKKLED